MPSTLGRAPSSAITVGRPVERVLLIVAALAIVTLWVGLVHEPPRVALTIQNPGACSVWVDVAHADGSGRIDLGPVVGGAERQLPRLLDRGRVWLFRFSVNGHVATTDAVNRSDLEARGWRYAVPNRPELAPADCAGPPPA